MVGTVSFGVGRLVGNRVLRAHLVLDLAEDLVERMVAVDFEHLPAGF
jgi:hypothetical protein